MVEFVDWPSSIIPVGIKVRLASSRIDGGLTGGGVAFSSTEPGGRWVADLSFNHMKTAAASRLFGWLLDEMEGGTVIRLTIGEHVETIRNADIGASGEPIPYISNGIETFHSDGSGFAAMATARSVGSALEGAATIAVHMGTYGHVLKPGHLLSWGNEINRVRSLTWETAQRAALTLRVPILTDMADDTIIRLQKQKMLVQASRAAVQTMRTLHEYGFLTQPGSVSLMEYRP